jgi:hypothetical protein
MQTALSIDLEFWRAMASAIPARSARNFAAIFPDAIFIPGASTGMTRTRATDPSSNANDPKARQTCSGVAPLTWQRCGDWSSSLGREA